MFRRFVFGLVTAGLFLGGVAWVRSDKTVQLEIDGVSRRVHTNAATVGGVLERIDVPVGEHDVLAPAPDVKVREGSQIVIRRGRQLHLMLNGHRRDVWVTALSVDEALTDLGYVDSRSFVSASRSRPIGLDGLDMTLRLPVAVRVLVGGKLRSVVSTAPSVRDLLRVQHIKLGRFDLVSPSLSTYPKAGTVVRVARVRGAFQDVFSVIGHQVDRRPDASMYRDQRKVILQGVDGLLLKRYGVVFKDGKLVARRLRLRKVMRAPKTGILAYGTKRRPYAVGGSADGLNWPALARCESGGNPRAVSSNGNYRGLYQFTLGTWRAMGGSGDPIDASSAEQTYRAKLLYQRRGRQPWPVCGRYL